MAQNPLLGNRISLVSKKNIRYEGTLYSINEANATVALQNVKSYGTEGREKTDAATTFVAPQDAVHPYLLFRGCDIRDLHVHEAAKEDKDAAEGDAPPAEAPVKVKVPLPSKPPTPQPKQQQQNKPATTTATTAQAPKNQSQVEEKQATSPDNKKKNEKENQDQQRPKQHQPYQGGRGGGAYNRRPRKPNPAHQVGTGASLLNRKARGTVDGGPETPEEEFDFQSKLAEFTKEGDDDNDNDDEEDAGDTPNEAPATAPATAYEKDDFFDSISCDALDRQAGIDNRLRGATERSLNTETFGAVALNSQRRRRRGGGRGGRGRGGRGRSGRGRGRGGRGRNNGRWHNSNGNPGYANNNQNAQPQNQNAQPAPQAATS
jgi:protein LSM14